MENVLASDCKSIRADKTDIAMHVHLFHLFSRHPPIWFYVLVLKKDDAMLVTSPLLNPSSSTTSSIHPGKLIIKRTKEKYRKLYEALDNRSDMIFC